MGYTTDFEGQFTLDHPLDEEHAKILHNFSETRHEGYDAGPKLGYWCDWAPTEDGRAIAHNGGEKFYNYVGWLELLLEKFLIPWGYKLNGKVVWQGEDMEDRGKIVVVDNVVSVTFLE